MKVLLGLAVALQVPNPYAALPQAWAQQQQGQQAQQQWQAGQPPPAAAHPFPYPPGMPVIFPYGVPQQQGPAMPIRVQMAGGAFPAMPGAVPHAGMPSPNNCSAHLQPSEVT